jgi:predicted enzyme related to lactoylglutathione lyase
MTSLVIFSANVGRLSEFYASVLGVTPVEESTGDIRLTGPRDEVVVHSVSPMMAEKIASTIPPEPRDGAVIKPIFDVDSLEVAVESVDFHGGVITDRTFTLNGLVRRDVLDPDGNVIQLRSRKS